MRDCDGDGGGDSGACNRDLGRSDMRHGEETRRMSSDSEEGDAIVCSDLPRRSAKRNEAMQCNNEGVRHRLSCLRCRNQEHAWWPSRTKSVQIYVAEKGPSLPYFSCRSLMDTRCEKTSSDSSQTRVKSQKPRVVKAL